MVVTSWSGGCGNCQALGWRRSQSTLSRNMKPCRQTLPRVFHFLQDFWQGHTQEHFSSPGALHVAALAAKGNGAGMGAWPSSSSLVVARAHLHHSALYHIIIHCFLGKKIRRACMTCWGMRTTATGWAHKGLSGRAQQKCFPSSILYIKIKMPLPISHIKWEQALACRHYQGWQGSGWRCALLLAHHRIIILKTDAILIPHQKQGERFPQACMTLWWWLACIRRGVTTETVGEDGGKQVAIKETLPMSLIMLQSSSKHEQLTGVG